MEGVQTGRSLETPAPRPPFPVTFTALGHLPCVCLRVPVCARVHVCWGARGRWLLLCLGRVWAPGPSSRSCWGPTSLFSAAVRMVCGSGSSWLPQGGTAVQGAHAGGAWGAGGPEGPWGGGLAGPPLEAARRKGSPCPPACRRRVAASGCLCGRKLVIDLKTTAVKTPLLEAGVRVTQQRRGWGGLSP